MRKALRETFPGIKFSVRMDRGTAYGCFTVFWTDGPNPKEVDAVIDKFQGKDFDGTDDSTDYRGPVKETVNGREELHSYRAGYICSSRDYSDAFKEILRAKVLEDVPSPIFPGEEANLVYRLGFRVSLWSTGKVKAWPTDSYWL